MKWKLKSRQFLIGTKQHLIYLLPFPHNSISLNIYYFNQIEVAAIKFYKREIMKEVYSLGYINSGSMPRVLSPYPFTSPKHYIAVNIRFSYSSSVLYSFC